jgi:methylglyoxal synthase
MYIFIKEELTTVPHLPDEKGLIAFAFVVDSTT